MATAKLWWNGSNWVSSSAYWKNETTGQDSDYAKVRYTIQIVAYDDATIKLTAALWAINAAVYGSPEISSGTKTVKSGNTTIGTGSFTADVTNKAAFSYSGNVYTRCWWNGSEYSGAASYTNGNTTITSPFATITYDANGGSGAPSAKTTTKGSTSLSSAEPTRTGYTVLGWATSSSATTPDYASGGTYNLSSNVTLYAVWKAELSTVSASDGTIGTAMNITITQQGTTYNYNHTLLCLINGASTTIQTGITGSGSTITVSWTPPTSLITRYTDRHVYPCTIYCGTYDGDTLLGSTSVSINLTVPNDYAPDLSCTLTRTAGTYPSLLGRYVSGKTTPYFSSSATPKYNATIVKWEYTINGNTAVIEDSSTSTTYTGEAPVNTGSTAVFQTLTIKVTDSRGLSQSIGKQITVVPYFTQTIDNLMMARALSDGTLDSNGEYLKVSADVEIAPTDNYNTKQYSVEYREYGSSIWQTADSGTLSSYSLTFTWLSSTDIIDESKSYETRLVITDFYGSVTASSTVSTAQSVMDFKANGLGVAFGKVSQTDYAIELESGWFLDFDGETFTKADATYVDGLPSLIGSIALPTTAQDITGAIDELHTDIGNVAGDVSTLQGIVANLHEILVESVSCGSITTSSQYKDFSKSVAKTGYTAVGVVGWDCGNTYLSISKAQITSNTLYMAIRKINSGDVTVTPYVWVLYTKD